MEHDDAALLDAPYGPRAALPAPDRLTSTGEDVSLSRINPLWWPPAKVVGHYLAPFLGVLAGTEAPNDPEPPPKAIPVNIELDDGIGAALTPPEVAGRLGRSDEVVRWANARDTELSESVSCRPG